MPRPKAIKTYENLQFEYKADAKEYAIKQRIKGYKVRIKPARAFLKSRGYRWETFLEGRRQSRRKNRN